MNAWNEPPEPNPVAQIIAVRTAQVCGVTGAILAGMATFAPAHTVGAAAIVGTVLGTAGLSAHFLRTFDPRTIYAGVPLLVRLPPESNTVALTFDDGPHPDTTPRLLDILAEADARATFFVVAERAARFPSLARRIAANGHAVGIHGLRHRTMALFGAAKAEAELTQAANIIENALGAPLLSPRLLRPPYGFRSRTLSEAAHRLGFLTVAWSLDGRDYDPATKSVAARIAASLVPGDIVLLHERPAVPVAAEALGEILAGIAARGLLAEALTP